jgi:hypothetical protein
MKQQLLLQSLWDVFAIAAVVVATARFLDHYGFRSKNAGSAIFPSHLFSSQYRLLPPPPHHRRRRLQEPQQQQGATARQHESTSTEDKTRPRPQIRQQQQRRLLYIVTSIHEYDIGRRETVKGYDRFTHTLVPVIRDGVRSMLVANDDANDEGDNNQTVVDVYLIAQYNVTDARYAQLRAALPQSVGLEVWSDATPLYYLLEYTDDTSTTKGQIRPHTRGLARQHRYVIKDKLFHYDVFVNFEDDMLVRGPHIQHYVDLTDQLYTWRRQAIIAHRVRSKATVSSIEEAKEMFYGPMTYQQLARTIPGFIRVEAALADFVPVKRNQFAQIPVSYDYYHRYGHEQQQQQQPEYQLLQQQQQNYTLDPSVCCHLDDPVSHGQNVQTEPPPITNLYHWETSIDALGVRRMPNDVDWVVLLGGSNNEIWDVPDYVVGDYWSGRTADHYFGTQARPDRKKGRYMSNQGGWMATRRQIKEWHERWCRGGFLPYVLCD